MNKLQKTLLDMMDWIHCFCEKENITYYIVGGTMLGAIRHKGFIPWDDDIDIAMPRNDYLRFINLLKKEKDCYIVESPYSNNADYPYSFAKFYNINTTQEECLRYKFVRGVFIDIFPLDGVGNDYTIALKHNNKVKKAYAKLIGSVGFFDKKRKWYKNLYMMFRRLIPLKLINLNKLELNIEKLRQNFNYDDSKYVGCLGTQAQEREIFSKDIYGKPTLYEFESKQFFGPEKFDFYLTQKYKEYMNVPAKNKQIKHKLSKINLNKSWKEVEK